VFGIVDVGGILQTLDFFFLWHIYFKILHMKTICSTEFILHTHLLCDYMHSKTDKKD